MRLARFGCGWLLAFGVFGLASCGGDESSPDASGDTVETGTGDTSDDTSDDTTDQSLAGDGSDETSDDADEGSDSEASGWATYESPISAALGVPTDPTEQQDFYNVQQVEREQFIAQCMAEQGFEYIPVDYSQYNDFSGAVFDEQEYVEEYGFGISTTFLEGFEGQVSADEFVDPNQDYVEALSDPEREAYYLALYGDQSIYEELDPNGEGIEITPEIMAQQGGCQNESNAAVNDPYQAFYTEFNTQLEDMYERIQADPRVAGVAAEWSACMEDEGYTFASPEEMYNEISERMNPFYELAYPSDFSDEAPAEAVTSQDEGITESTAVYVPPGPPELTDAQQAELEDLQEYEFAVAAANYECQQGSVAIQIEVQAEYEQAFVEENQAAIDALLAG